MSVWLDPNDSASGKGIEEIGRSVKVQVSKAPRPRSFKKGGASGTLS